MSKLIALDAGHGTNSANGANGLKEFNFNAAVAKMAQDLLEINGFRVLQLQPLGGQTRSLSARTDLARSRKVDMCFSIHADASSKPEPDGFWAFYWHTDSNAKRLATMWHKHAKAVMKIFDRGTRSCQWERWPNFHMVRVPATNNTHRFPAILMEHGFMTNLRDVALLKTTAYRKLCAEALVRTVCEYYGVTFRTSAPTQPVQQPANTITHTVVAGENLGVIANRYKTTVDEIMKLNPQITNRNLISIGQQIIVPTSVSAPAPTPTTYTVVSGDKLGLIAQRFKVSEQELVDWNSAKYPSLRTNRHYIDVGWILIVLKPATEIYIVRDGDTMWGIARKFKVALATLVAANPQITNPHRIKRGDQVIIPS